MGRQCRGGSARARMRYKLLGLLKQSHQVLYNGRIAKLTEIARRSALWASPRGIVTKTSPPDSYAPIREENVRVRTKVALACLFSAVLNEHQLPPYEEQAVSQRPPLRLMKKIRGILRMPRLLHPIYALALMLRGTQTKLTNCRIDPHFDMYRVTRTVATSFHILTGQLGFGSTRWKDVLTRRTSDKSDL